jgi:hypothetical protein
VAIDPSWQMLEEIEFHRLAKLRLEVDEPEELYVTLAIRYTSFRTHSPSSESYGRLYPYNKAYDRITTKTERPLQPVDRIKYNTTTSDDPIIQQVRMTIVKDLSFFLFLFWKACVQAYRGDLCDGYHPQRPYVCAALGVSLGHRYCS